MAKANSVKREIGNLERRVADAEAVNKIIMRTHETLLASAELLRKLAVLVTSSQGRFDARRKTREVNNVAVQRLEALVTDLPPFYKSPQTPKKKTRR